MPSTTPTTPPTASVMWFRRDLRLGDNPALLAACDAGPVLPVFVVDPVLWDRAGGPRTAYLSASLAALDATLRDQGGALVVLHGDPVEVLVALARDVGAGSVHVAADHGPYGASRDERVEHALARRGVALERTGSPYAVAPGRVVNGQGRGYSVFTPFLKAWTDHGWRAPLDPPAKPRWVASAGDGLPSAATPEGLSLPRAGERAALEHWRGFLEDRLEDYGDGRDQPALNGTSHMSVHLKWGEVHPRTLLADLARHGVEQAAKFRSELAWREFYADVLRRRPETARQYLRPEFARMEYDDPGDGFTAWAEGRTGFPLVDAGMRQLRATGWMHNRVRMITASFLVKDLHVEWQHGARHFMRWLVDGDLASNQHGWQWVAGSGTDAAPYFRIFNPTAQGRKFDPDGGYVRRWVSELRDVDNRYVHKPAKDPAGLPAGYPPPLVDHAQERREALTRLERIKK